MTCCQVTRLSLVFQEHFESNGNGNKSLKLAVHKCRKKQFKLFLFSMIRHPKINENYQVCYNLAERDK